MARRFGPVLAWPFATPEIFSNDSLWRRGGCVEYRRWVESTLRPYEPVNGRFSTGNLGRVRGSNGSIAAVTTARTRWFKVSLGKSNN